MTDIVRPDAASLRDVVRDAARLRMRNERGSQVSSLVSFLDLSRMTELPEEGQESKPCSQVQLWLRCDLIRWM